MGAVTKLFVITILAIVCTNGAHVSNYVPMDLKEYRDKSPEAAPEIPLLIKDSEHTKKSKESSESEESTENNNKPNEEIQSMNKKSDEVEDNTTERKKKSATTFCVEIKPSDPYHKPYKVCHSSPPEVEYGPPVYHQQPAQHIQPVYYQQPIYQNQPQQQPAHRPVSIQSYEPQHSAGLYNVPEKKPQTGYAAPPSYGQQPSSKYSPASAIVVPHHVPVAEPYHAPQAQTRPGSGAYRTSGNMDGWELVNADAEEVPDDNARTAYNSYEPSYEHGKTLYKYEKEKKIDYVPVIVKTIKKTKPLKILKVLKDIKKGKYMYDCDKPGYGSHGYGGHEYGGHEYGGHEYGGPEYGGHEYGGHEYGGHEYPEHGYGGHEYGGHEYGGHGHGGHEFGHGSEIFHETDIAHHDGNQHGLVITCQPSAVGYSGGQSHAELQRINDFLKLLSSSGYSGISGDAAHSTGVVAHSTGVVAHSTGVTTSVSNGNEGSYVPPGTYRISGGEAKNWDQATQQRSSNGEQTNWDTNSQMNINLNENIGNPMIPSSVQPMMVSPTENVQKQLDTTASFRANRFQSNQATS